MAGVGPTPPEHCKTIRDGCNEIWVRKSDETKECYSGKSIFVNTVPSYPSIMPYLQDMFYYAQQHFMSNNLVPSSSTGTQKTGQVDTNTVVPKETIPSENHPDTPSDILLEPAPAVGNYIDRRFIHPNMHDVYHNPFRQYMFYNTFMN